MPDLFLHNKQLSLIEVGYVKTLTTGRTVAQVLHILMNYFLPHMGELNFKSKGFILGLYCQKDYYLYQLAKTEKPTDRDSFEV